ncbi:hypothetical protein [Flavobacterium sp. HJSW_4]|uniref:hypothetical protein n=1 Tax=Flavobacterium sp. HJSW_4 TaxID=3344660 RepID=UPI0035F40C4D
MKKKYIQFAMPKECNGSSMYDLLSHLGEDYMRYMSDFGEITEWLIEFSDFGKPIREVGFKRGEVILKLPDNEIVGFWQNSKLTENDLRMFFKVSIKSESIFQENWESFEKTIYNFQTEIKKYRYVINIDDNEDYSYLKTIIKFKDKRRVLRIYFSNKEGDNTIQSYNFFNYSILKICGQLKNYGIDSDLYLLESELMD